MDAGRLRDLDRRRRDRADLRDLVGRAGRLDPRRLRRRRRRSSRRRDARRDAGRGPRPACPGCATSGRSTTAASTSWPPPAPTIADAELDERRGDGSTAPTSPRSSTPPAPPGGPRAASSPTATSCAEPTNTVERARRGRLRRGRLDAAVPAAGARVRPGHRGAVRPGRRRLGHTADIKQPARTTSRASSPTFILAVPRVFEKVYNSAEQKAAADGKGKIFAAAADDRDRLEPGAATTAVPARCCGSSTRCSTGWSTPSCAAASAAGSQYAVSGGAPLGDAARPLLPRHRPHRPRGLRPDRDHRAGHGEPPGRDQDRHGRAAAARRRDPDRRRRRDPGQGRPTSSRGYWQQRRRPPPRRSTTAGSTPATSASSTTTASCGSPAARRRSSSPPAARTSRPPCSRTGSAPTRCVASASSSATRSRSSPRWSPSTRRCCRPGPSNHGLGELTVDAGRATHEVVRAEVQKAVDEANKAVSQAESIRKFAILAGRLHRGERLPHPVAEAQAQRRDEGLRDEVEALYSGPRE